MEAFDHDVEILNLFLSYSDKGTDSVISVTKGAHIFLVLVTSSLVKKCPKSNMSISKDIMLKHCFGKTESHPYEYS